MHIRRFAQLFLMTITASVGVLAAGEQPDRASDFGRTGTEASPTGSPAPPPTALFLDLDLVCSASAQSPSSPTHLRPAILQLTNDCVQPALSATAPPNVLPNDWKEISASLRAVADAVRSLPQQCEERWQLVQRATAVGFAAGRARGWLEGAAVAGLALGLLSWWRSRPRQTKSS